MQLNNTRIDSFKKLLSPASLRKELPLTPKIEETVTTYRQEFSNILSGQDKRLAVIVGPCSIHDPKAAIEYAKKLKDLSEKISDKLLLIMRVYFEKPRTTTGWKGLINDPHLDGTEDMESGIRLARKILIDINQMGLPAATEFLDPITAAYIGELVSWAAIGARTTESQTHRQMASGLSAPVGFKNSTDGSLDVAINAIKAAQGSHSFIGIDDEANCSIVKTSGNDKTHIILRGSQGHPNYQPNHITEAEEKLKEAGFRPNIMVDCSHENSAKDHTKQKTVVSNIISQIQDGNTSIIGLMLESHLNEGNQKIPDNLETLKYGVSITDACINWEETETLLALLANNL